MCAEVLGSKLHSTEKSVEGGGTNRLETHREEQPYRQSTSRRKGKLVGARPPRASLEVRNKPRVNIESQP